MELDFDDFDVYNDLNQFFDDEEGLFILGFLIFRNFRNVCK